MTYSFYHLFYRGQKYGQILPEFYKEEEFKFSLNNEIIKATYPDGKTYEIPLKNNDKEICIIRIDYKEQQAVDWQAIDKEVIKIIDLTKI